MRYMIMFKADGATEAAAPACVALPEMGDFIERLMADGIVVATEGLKPSASGARVSYARGRMTVTDGPFTEAKELVAGFALVELPDRAAAVDLAREFLRIAGEGSQAEVREVIGA